MKTIKVSTYLVEKVSSRYGVSPEKYIGDSMSVTYGFSVCAHFVRAEGEFSFFDLTRV